MTDGVLVTDRLALRHVTPEDAAFLVELDADPEVRRYVSPRPTTPEDAQATIAEWLEEYDRWPGMGYWIAVERVSGEPIGWFHLRPGGDRPREDEPEVGYRLRRDRWGRGYATEGTRAVVDHAFGALGANLVWAEAMTVNAASRRVLEKSGLRFVNTVHNDWPDRLPGDEHGEARYELTREAWEGART